MLTPSSKQPPPKQPATLAAWVGCLLPLLAIPTIIGGNFLYLERSQRRAADYDHSPDCRQGVKGRAELPPCTYSQASVTKVNRHFAIHSYSGTDLSLQTPEGRMFQVTVAGARAYYGVHPGDTATVQHWSGTVAFVDIRNSWYEAVTNPDNCGHFDFDWDVVLPIVGCGVTYLCFGSLLPKPGKPPASEISQEQAPPVQDSSD